MESKRLSKFEEELFYNWCVDYYRSTILGVTLSFLRQNEGYDTEDTIQDIHILIWRKIQHIAKAYNRKAFIRKMVRNALIDMGRKKARRPVEYLYDDFDNEGDSE